MCANNIENHACHSTTSNFSNVGIHMSFALINRLKKPIAERFTIQIYKTL